jgi:prepilin peptidase CpaA
MMIQFFVFGVFPGLVFLAAAMDMFTMTIPNKLCLALVAAFFAAVPFAALPIATVGWHVGAALIALAITFLLFASGVFGGGDAKLTTAIVLWLGPTLALDFALLAALFGGLLTAGLMTLRAFPSYTISVESSLGDAPAFVQCRHSLWNRTFCRGNDRLRSEPLVRCRNRLLAETLFDHRTAHRSIRSPSVNLTYTFTAHSTLEFCVPLVGV